ncbi:MAG: hypothetical protein SOZ13_07705 [Enterococcus avium]|nr:hypothetical protein [Enterococcus avium]
MMKQIKRNMIQVRLTDKQLEEFEKVKNKLNAKNNAAALRKLIEDKKLTSESTQGNITSLIDGYNDLSNKLDALMWDSRNIANSMNQIAHSTNVARKVDPANTETWNWVLKQLQSLFPPIKKMNSMVSELKKQIKESRDGHGSTDV